MDQITQDIIIDIHSIVEVYIPEIFSEILHISDRIEIILIIITFTSFFNIGLLLLILSELKKLNEKEK